MDLVVIYRSQSGNQKHLTQILEKLIDKEKPMMILGDFNFGFMDNNYLKNFFDKLGLHQEVTQPTQDY